MREHLLLGGLMGCKCDRCGNFDEGYREEMEYPKDSDHCIQDYQPECYYYWDSPLEEDYDWRDAAPHVDCMCEICFDISITQVKSNGRRKILLNLC